MALQVRRSTYRDVEGWLISGRRSGQVGGWPTSIFCLTEGGAREIQAGLNAGDDEVVSRVLKAGR